MGRAHTGREQGRSRKEREEVDLSSGSPPRKASGRTGPCSQTHGGDGQDRGQAEDTRPWLRFLLFCTPTATRSAPRAPSRPSRSARCAVTADVTCSPGPARAQSSPNRRCGRRASRWRALGQRRGAPRPAPAERVACSRPGAAGQAGRRVPVASGAGASARNARAASRGGTAGTATAPPPGHSRRSPVVEGARDERATSG